MYCILQGNMLVQQSNLHIILMTMFNEHLFMYYSQFFQHNHVSGGIVRVCSPELACCPTQGLFLIDP